MGREAAVPGTLIPSPKLYCTPETQHLSSLLLFLALSLWPDHTPPTSVASMWRGKVVQQRPLSLAASHCVQRHWAHSAPGGAQQCRAQACGCRVYRGKLAREACVGENSPGEGGGGADYSPAEPEGRACEQRPGVEWRVCPCQCEPTCCAGCRALGFGNVVA